MGNTFKPFGPTGRYPRGKLNKDDDGELQMGIAVDPIQQVIKINFGVPIKWFAIDSTRARELSKILSDKADELDRKKT